MKSTVYLCCLLLIIATYSVAQSTAKTFTNPLLASGADPWVIAIQAVNGKTPQEQVLAICMAILL